jgi:hypothetical protein
MYFRLETDIPAAACLKDNIACHLITGAMTNALCVHLVSRANYKAAYQKLIFNETKIRLTPVNNPLGSMTD